MQTRFGKFFLGLAVAASFLVVLESLARIAHTIVDDFEEQSNEASDWSGFQPSLELGWIRSPNFHGRTMRTHFQSFDRHGYRTIDSDQVADSETDKVVFIGDSNTFGYDVPTDATFVEVADRLLPQYAAINLGVPGYSSYQGLQVAREYLPILKPRIAVISFNYNDRRYVPESQEPDGAARFRALPSTSSGLFRRSLQAVAEYSYLYRGLRRVLRAAVIAPTESAKDIQVRLDRVKPRVDEEAYRNNLTEVVALCRKHSARPMFLLLCDNPVEAGPLYAGIQSFKSGNPLQAIAELMPVVNQRQALADLARVYASKAYRMIDKDDQADELLKTTFLYLASLDGGGSVRLDTDYNQCMRDVAVSQHVELVDARGVLREIPGVFIDSCHFNEEGHQKIGELIAARIAQWLREDATDDN
jgi:lysophospholipase L1-like esterase